MALDMIFMYQIYSNREWRKYCRINEGRADILLASVVALGLIVLAFCWRAHDLAQVNMCFLP